MGHQRVSVSTLANLENVSCKPGLLWPQGPEELVKLEASWRSWMIRVRGAKGEGCVGRGESEEGIF